MPLFRKSKSPPRPAPKTGRGKPGKRWLPRPLRWLGYAVFAFLGLTILIVLCFRFVPVPVTPLMVIRCLGDAPSGACLEKTWRPLERISPRLAEAVVAAEDQRFFDHNGFDWGAIGSALDANVRGKRKRGASTISQQTAKNLFLWPGRTWVRKGLEAYFTVMLETLWSKRRILEVYLNIIETGDGTYGAEAAARRYFQVTAAELTGAQAALLASVLPNPRKWSPARPTAYLLRRQAWILRQMGHLGPMPDGLSAGGPRSGPPAAPPASGSVQDTLEPSAPRLPDMDGTLPSPDPLGDDPEPLPDPEEEAAAEPLPAPPAAAPALPYPAIPPDSAVPGPENP